MTTMDWVNAVCAVAVALAALTAVGVLIWVTIDRRRR